MLHAAPCCFSLCCSGLLQGTTAYYKVQLFYRRPSDAAPQGTAPRALIFNLQRGRGRALRAGGFLRAAAAAAGRLGAAQPGQRALGTPGSQRALGTPEPGPSVCRFRPSYPKWRDARALVCGGLRPFSLRGGENRQESGQCFKYPRFRA